MLLAEIEVRHSRAIAPTRRVALGELWLPVDPAPGPGGLLLAGIVGAWSHLLDDDVRDGLDRLIRELEAGRRIAQPRLRHRFQEDTHGLDRSRHRLVGTVGESVRLDLDAHGSPLQQILGAVYAAGMLSYQARPEVFRLLRRATRWEGDAGDALVTHLRGDGATFRARRDGEVFDEGWALSVLGFRNGSEPGRGDVLRRFRNLVREAHPDHGGDIVDAGQRITDLTEAKRILTGA